MRAELNKEELASANKGLLEIIGQLKKDTWGNEKIKDSIILMTEATLIIGEALLKISGEKLDYSLDIDAWLGRYRENWLADSKESELKNIEELMAWTKTL